MTLTDAMIRNYKQYLHSEERSTATIEKYLHDVSEFAAWLGDRELTKETATAWKLSLHEKNLTPTTVNARISALNGFFRYIGREDCRLRFLKVQRRIFRDAGKELSREEYEKLVSTAERLDLRRLALVVETICATGIRVSELQYVTMEAVREGKAQIHLKGKVRTILLPSKLCRKLLKYAKKEKIPAGPVFRTRTGNPLNRRQIWAEMKKLCRLAGVEEGKVFPHNLRHLFARTYYKASRDIVRLADILGHSSIETTRIYLVSTGEEHARQMERLGLVS